YQRKEEFVNRYGFFFDEDVIDIITHWAMEEGISVGTAYEETTKITQKVKVFESGFFDAYGLRITFAEDAMRKIIQECIIKNRNPADLCKSSVQNYQYGLNLIKEKTGQDTFTIHGEALIDSEKYLNTLIQDSYE
ncbi:MAG: hypothetical protein JXD19_05820, partial [Deltaproteobacteria bacterium]|nr:hypothetical protein [Deltaproteobacteria bacterium]